jgi:5-methylthioadenosine/S-adenosylhomocysteine deaminase
MNLIIEGGTVVTLGSKGTIRNSAIIIEDGNIIDVGKLAELKPKYRGYEKIDAKNKVVIPGLINTHQHAAMSLLRGYADDFPLQEWLEKWVWPLEKHMKGHDIYVGALLTALDSVLGGTTTINTMYHCMDSEENEAKAFAEIGLRGVVGHVCFSWRKNEDRKALEMLAKNWHGKNNGLIRVSVCPHSPYTVDQQYWKELRLFADELNEKYGSKASPIMLHTHLAETEDEKEKISKTFNMEIKGGIVEFLDSLKVLKDDVIAAHCVWLSSRDIEILSQKGIKVSHNPISNLKLASGISPVPDLLRANVTVGLGTDSPCSNNSSDMFEIMKTTALIHKGFRRDPTLLSTEKVLRMATVEGAKALLWDKQIGSIEVSKRADLALIDFKKPHLCPLYNEVSHLVYSAKAADVDTVIIDGKIIMENREIKTINSDKVMEMAEKTKENLLNRLKSEFSDIKLNRFAAEKLGEK